MRRMGEQRWRRVEEGRREWITLLKEVKILKGCNAMESMFNCFIIFKILKFHEYFIFLRGNMRSFLLKRSSKSCRKEEKEQFKSVNKDGVFEDQKMIWNCIKKNGTGGKFGSVKECTSYSSYHINRTMRH